MPLSIRQLFYKREEKAVQNAYEANEKSFSVLLIRTDILPLKAVLIKVMNRCLLVEPVVNCLIFEPAQYGHIISSDFVS